MGQQCEQPGEVSIDTDYKLGMLTCIEIADSFIEIADSFIEMGYKKGSHRTWENF